MDTLKLAKWFVDQGKKHEKREESPSKLAIYLIIAALAFIVIALVVWAMKRQGKKLAKALHERDVLREEQVRREVENDLTKDKERVKNNEEVLKELREKDKALVKEIVDLEENLEFEKAKIDAIENWDDIDAYFARNPTYAKRLGG